MKLRSIYVAVILLASIHSFAGPGDEGKTIFISRCASCHNVNKIIVGPALSGVEKRHNIDWIIKFVQSSKSVISSGDQEAVALYNKYNHIPMPDHSDLSEEQIKGIVSYITAEAKAASTIPKAPFERPSKLRPGYLPLSLTEYHFFIFLFAGIALLTISLLVLVRVKEIERSQNLKNKEYDATCQ